MNLQKHQSEKLNKTLENDTSKVRNSRSSKFVYPFHSKLLPKAIFQHSFVKLYKLDTILVKSNISISFTPVSFMTISHWYFFIVQTCTVHHVHWYIHARSVERNKENYDLRCSYKFFHQELPNSYCMCTYWLVIYYPQFFFFFCKKNKKESHE